jgi:hypothetical protein
MKDTTSIIPSAILYTILLCGPTALTAEVGEGTRPVDRQQATQARQGERPRNMVLGPEQLDKVVAGDTVACTSDGRNCVQVSPNVVTCPATHPTQPTRNFQGQFMPTSTVRICSYR